MPPRRHSLMQHVLDTCKPVMRFNHLVFQAVLGCSDAVGSIRANPFHSTRLCTNAGRHQGVCVG